MSYQDFCTLSKPDFGDAEITIKPEQIDKSCRHFQKYIPLRKPKTGKNLNKNIWRHEGQGLAQPCWYELCIFQPLCNEYRNLTYFSETHFVYQNLFIAAYTFQTNFCSSA